MKVIVPNEFFSSATMLSTNVADSHLIGLWNPTIAYALNKVVRLHPTTIYSSLNFGEYDPAYSPGIPRYYRCVQGPITNCHPVLGDLSAVDGANSSALHWLDIGPVSAWAMMDTNLSSVTTRNALSFSMASILFDSIAMFNVSCASVTVTVRYGSVTGTVLYTKTEVLSSSKASDISFQGLPDASDTSVVTVTFTGTAKVGTIVFGTLQDLGPIEYGATLSITDYSKKKTDEFGVTTFSKRNFSKRLSIRAMFSNTDLKSVFDVLSSVRATPCVWLTVDQALDENGIFTMLNTFGYYQSFSIEVAYATQSYCSLEIEGLA